MKFINIILIITVMLTPILATTSHAMMASMDAIHCPEMSEKLKAVDDNKITKRHDHATMKAGSEEKAIDFCCMEACCTVQALVLNHIIQPIKSKVVVFSHYTNAFSPSVPEVIAPPPKV